MSQARRPWQEILLNRKMVICIFLGFTSGLPLYVLIQLVPAWLRIHEIDLATIGLFALVGLPYTWKFLWSPVMDRFRPPFLGRRRGWALITQVGLLVSIGVLGGFNPQQSLDVIVVLVFIVSVFGASQDIVIDAYRRELLADDELGTGNSLFVNAFRVALLVPGSLALILSDHLPWTSVYWITAAFMLIGIVTTLVIREVADDSLAPQSMREAVVEPFTEFFSRGGVRSGLLVLAFMFLYKLGDNMATALATPFYLDMGYSATEIGTVAKLAGFWGSIAGGLLGGALMLYFSINRALWIFGFVQVATIPGYIWLSTAGHTLGGLLVVVGAEYIGVGLGAVALIAFMSRETSRSFTATQFALFSSLIAVPRTFANASTGFLIEGWGDWAGLGWTHFFLLCTVLAIPGMLLLFKVAPWNGSGSTAQGTPAPRGGPSSDESAAAGGTKR